MHDSRIDLSQNGETVYRDKGNFGVKPLMSMDKTMHRAVHGHPLSIKENQRNKAISRIRSLVERPFAAMKRVFRAGYSMVTTVARVREVVPKPLCREGGTPFHSLPQVAISDVPQGYGVRAPKVRTHWEAVSVI